MKKKILLVEDNKDLVEILLTLLDRQGFETFFAYNGKAALDKINSISPQVVITDINLQQMDGLELLKIIKEKYDKIEVIILTATGDADDALKAEQLGAYAYIEKPFKNEELKQLLNQIIGNDV